MGLDFIGSEAHWSYSGFMIFREKVWNTAGFKGKLENLYNNNFYLNQITSKHPLFWLFHHSDCEGFLTVNRMKKIYPALQNIINQWDKDDWYKKEAQQWINDMKNLIKNNKKMEFC